MCWAAQMCGSTLQTGSTHCPWLSQTSAGGQRSGLAFLCPNPPWVPTYPLSRGSLSPVTHTASTCSFFSVPLFGSHYLQVSLTIVVSQLLLVSMSHFNSLCYFFHLSLCLLSLFSLFATVIFGQQLSWHACRGSYTSFSRPLCLSLPLYPSFPHSLSCALPWHWRDRFTRQQLRQASFVPGLPSEKAFFASGELLTAHGDIECLIALLPNLAVMFFSGSLRCWTQCTLSLKGEAFL